MGRVTFPSMRRDDGHYACGAGGKCRLRQSAGCESEFIGASTALLDSMVMEKEASSAKLQGRTAAILNLPYLIEMAPAHTTSQPDFVNFCQIRSLIQLDRLEKQIKEPAPEPWIAKAELDGDEGSGLHAASGGSR